MTEEHEEFVMPQNPLKDFSLSELTDEIGRRNTGVLIVREFDVGDDGTDMGCSWYGGNTRAIGLAVKFILGFHNYQGD
jgi:hypothetical protein